MSPERPEEAHVVRQGYLRRLKTMKRKYFVLKSESRQNSARLEYYDSEKKFRARTTPKRAIPLKSCFNITRRLDTKHKHVIALYTKEEGFCVVLESEDDLQSWLNALLALHHGEEGSDDIQHPKQHVWTVNVQKKGLGASKNILGLYNLCLTDKTISLTKIKANNNVTYDSCVPDHLEFSLRNIRRCGNSECFFYMEVGRQTVTGAGELWMHTEDNNIAASMHTTILNAMKTCNKEADPMPTWRDRSMSASDAAKPLSLQNRRHTADVGRTYNSSTHADHTLGCERDGLPPPAGLRIAHARTRSLPLAGDEPAVPLAEAAHNADRVRAWLARRASTGCRAARWSPAHPKNGAVRSRCDSMPSRVASRADIDCEQTPSRVPSQHLDEASSLDEVDGGEWTPAAHRTPRIPEEPDLAPYCEMNPPPPRRIPMKANSAHHSRNSSLAEDATPPDGYLHMMPGSLASTHAHTGYVDMNAGRASSPAASGSSVASGTPSTDLRFSEYHLDHVTARILLEDDERPIPRAYSVGSRPQPTPHARPAAQDTSRTRAFSVGSKTRGRPSTYAPSHAPPAVGNKTSSAPLLAPRSSDTLSDDLMELDFSNNQASPRNRQMAQRVARTPPSAGTGFTPPVYASIPRPPPKTDEYVDMSPRVSGYVEMKPGGLTPAADCVLPRSPPSGGFIIPGNVPETPDGYVQMNPSKKQPRIPSRPILILSETNRPHQTAATSTDSERSAPMRATPLLSPQTSRNGKKKIDRHRRNSKDAGTPVNAQTIFNLSLDSPMSPPRPPEDKELEHDDVFGHYAEVVGTTLSTVREMNEDGRKSQDLAGSPSDYVVLKWPTERSVSRPIAAHGKLDSDTADSEGLSCNPMATKTLTRDTSAKSEEVRPALVRAVSGPGRGFTPVDKPEVVDPPSRKSSSPKPVESALNRALKSESSTPPPLNYASLDLEPRGGPPPPSPTPAGRAYTQIDFVRSEKLNIVDTN